MLVVWGVVLTMCMLLGDAKMIEDIKLFDVVDLATDGVTETSGFHNNSKAYEFTEKAGALVANSNVSAMFAKEAFLLNEFTVKAYLKAASGSDGGTIVFFSDGKKRAAAAFNVVFKWSGTNSITVGTVIYVGDNAYTLSCQFKSPEDVSRNEWLHLSVRVHSLEGLIRCEIETEKRRRFFRYTGRGDADAPFRKFPEDGRLRLAQQLLAGSEDLKDIDERFVGKLQDVIISFGDPNCTTTIVENIQVANTGTPQVCPTTPTAKPTTKPPAVEDNTCLDGENNKRNDGDKWTEGKWVSCSCNKRRTYCVKSAKQCLHRGQAYIDGATWDDLTNCDRCKCENGIAKCASTVKELKKGGCARTCANYESGSCEGGKRNGCFCPGTQVLYAGQCVSRAACPCERDGKTYAAGETYEDGNQYCYCSGGTFTCL